MHEADHHLPRIVYIGRRGTALSSSVGVPDEIANSSSLLRRVRRREARSKRVATKFSSVGLVDQSNIKNQPHLFLFFGI